ncbi:MAG: 50S ribosomal protein L35 [Planctomycetes bacterium]|nr:50S ribosomal protein L35 [Planctomycetota bacterium]
MPKQKTCKAVTKRVKVTATGKVKRNKANRKHLLSGRTRKRKRSLRKAVVQGTMFGVKLRRSLRLPALREAAVYVTEETKAAAAAAPVNPAAGAGKAPAFVQKAK